MNDDTIVEVEGRSYINPQTGLDERLAFIDTLRDVQAQNTAEINQNTYNLGSQVPSNVGGLGGSEGLWQAQYQTPQTNAQVANLRAVAQQQALNQETQNLQAVYQNRYKQALRDFYARRKAESDAAKASAKGNVNNKPAQTISGNPTDPNTISSIPGQTVINQDGNGNYVGTNNAGHVVSRPNWELATVAISQLQNAGNNVGNVEKINDNLVRIYYIDKNGDQQVKTYYTDKQYGKTVDIPGMTPNPNQTLGRGTGGGW